LEPVRAAAAGAAIDPDDMTMLFQRGEYGSGFIGGRRSRSVQIL